MPADKTLPELTKEVVQIFAEYDKTGTNTWNYEIAAHDLPYQVGSLTKVVSQLKGNRYADGLSKEELLRKASDELADIMAEVLFVAHDLNIDMYEPWNGMVGSDQAKIKERS